MRGMFAPNRWVAPHGSFESKHGAIYLWRADLDRNVDKVPALAHVLAPEERTKALRFRREVDRDRYIITHAALRKILAWYLKVAPGELVFRCGARGKPELAGGAMHFNVSHSDDLALYAISRECDVGVDVERVRPGFDEDVPRCFFSQSAIRILEALPQPGRRRAFFQSWTRMEAYRKARGEGLTGLENFDIFLYPAKPALVRTSDDPPETPPWRLHDLFPRRGYVGALAARAAHSAI